MCKVQNERRRAIGDLHHIWCAQTHKRLAEKRQTNNNSPAACACSGPLRSSVVDVSQSFLFLPAYTRNISQTYVKPEDLQLSSGIRGRKEKHEICIPQLLL